MRNARASAARRISDGEKLAGWFGTRIAFGSVRGRGRLSCAIFRYAYFPVELVHLASGPFPLNSHNRPPELPRWSSPGNHKSCAGAATAGLESPDVFTAAVERSTTCGSTRRLQ